MRKAVLIIFKVRLQLSVQHSIGYYLVILVFIVLIPFLEAT